MSIQTLLQKLPAAIKAEEADGLEAVAQLNISSPVYLCIKDGVCEVHEGVKEDVDVTLTLADDVLVDLLTGKQNGVMAFMTGKLKVDGDIMLAKTFPELFDAAKLV